MRDRGSNRVLGRDGLAGVLIDAPPESGRDSRRVRVQLDTGQVIDIPGTMLRRHSPGTYEIPIGPSDIEVGSAAPSHATAPAPLTATDAVVPVLAEELHVGTRPVPTGGVRVHRIVHEHDEMIDVPLLKEHVDVRRVIVDREVDGPLPIRREGDTTIIPIVEEVLVIGKRFVLKEEVHVVRSVREERHQERVTLKRQEGEIERVDANGRRMPADTPTRATESPEPRRRPRRSILND